MADGYVMSRELKDMIQREMARLANSFQARPKRGRRARRAGGGGTDNYVAFAIVMEEAAGSAHSATGIDGGTVGRCILLDEDKQATVILDTGDVDYDAEAVETAKIEFKSNHRIPCIVGTIVSLDAPQKITPGSAYATNQVWGTLVDSVDELAQLLNFGAEKVLYSDGSAATDIQWGSQECVEEEEEE